MFRFGGGGNIGHVLSMFLCYLSATYYNCPLIASVSGVVRWMGYLRNGALNLRVSWISYISEIWFPQAPSNSFLNWHCLDGWMDGWIDEWMGEWMDGWMDTTTTRRRPTDGTAQNSKFKICAIGRANFELWILRKKEKARRDDGDRPDRPDRQKITNITNGGTTTKQNNNNMRFTGGVPENGNPQYVVGKRSRTFFPIWGHIFSNLGSHFFQFGAFPRYIPSSESLI